VIDEELVNPEAFALAVRARASYLSRQTMYETQSLRPYSQLTLLLGIELEKASEMLHERGLRGAYRWAVGHEVQPRPMTTPLLERD
jgi:hypothetical protein